MITIYNTDSPAAIAALADAASKAVWINGSKTIIYTGADIPPEPVLTQDEIDTVAAKATPKLAALISKTPAQIATWVDANVINLATAVDTIKTLAIALSVLGRRL